VAALAIGVAGLVVLSVLSVAAVAATRTDNARRATRLRVVVHAPRNVAANVKVVGRPASYVVATPAGQATRTVTLTVTPGAYRVSPERVIEGGRLYAATTAVRTVKLSRGRILTVRIRYAEVQTARSLHASAISRSGISLSWVAPKGAVPLLRRTDGTTPATRRSQGQRVATKGTTATDGGLVAGRQYSYALFTRVRGRWTGPVTMLATTAPPDGSTDASYVAAPTTLMPGPGDVAGELATGAGVRLTLTKHARSPVLGAAVVLAPSAALAGGYVGTVTAVSSDGRVLDLAPAGLGDAFDYYHFAAPDLSTGPIALTPTSTAGRSGMPDRGGVRSRGLSSCLGLSGSAAISYQPSLTLGGHSNMEFTKYPVLGRDVPVGASFDVAVTAAIAGAMALRTNITLSCSLPFKPIPKQVSIIAGVPIVLVLIPVASISASGTADVSNVGAVSMSGVQFKGTFGLDTPPSLSGSTMHSAAALVPHGTLTGSLGVQVGGQVLLGPGIGTPDAGVAIGFSGEVYPLDGSLKVISGTSSSAADTSEDPCFEVSLGSSHAYSLMAKAWVGGTDVSKAITADFLNGGRPEPGSPWHFPADCEKLKIDTQDLEPAAQNKPYAVTLQAFGGTKPYSWTRISGSLPEGLNLERNSGVISGTPTKAGGSTFEIAVTDDTLTTTARTFTLVVTPAPLDHLVLSPPSATISPGGTQPYTVEGFDSAGNDLGPVTEKATLSISPDGTCEDTAHSCTATAPGDHTVTATAGSASGTATLKVSSGCTGLCAEAPGNGTVRLSWPACGCGIYPDGPSQYLVWLYFDGVPATFIEAVYGSRITGPDGRPFWEFAPTDGWCPPGVVPCGVGTSVAFKYAIQTPPAPPGPWSAVSNTVVVK
jgi:hypothetical protein